MRVRVRVRVGFRVRARVGVRVRVRVTVTVTVTVTFTVRSYLRLFAVVPVLKCELVTCLRYVCDYLMSPPPICPIWCPMRCDKSTA